MRLTIFLSAFLLFTIEPLLAKRILPWFGGSSAVWATCLVFYQAALLLGYWYARLSARHLRSLTQCVDSHVPYWSPRACCCRWGQASDGVCDLSSAASVVHSRHADLRPWA